MESSIKSHNLSLNEHFTYIILRLISFIISFLPRSLNLTLGSYFGIFIKFFISKRKNVALQNIKFSFPKLNHYEHLKILNETYKHFGKILFEFLQMPYLDKNSINKIVLLDENTKNLLKKTKHGVILTAHYGNWEMIQAAFNFNDFNLVSVAQAQKNQGANKFFTWIRNKTNTKIIFKNETTIKMLNIVKNNFLGLASDQYAGKSGVKVPFFGKETLSPIGATYFHIKSGVPILIGFCKLKSDYTYSISFEELNTQDLSKNIRESSILVNKKFNSILENEILKQPEQFFWFHRKWR